tara:strand:- start:377 stop:1024 length:648 start_codon:yes stop_codon:yes gene_type:complete
MLKNKHFVFDLDDTLYKEIEFVKSAYNYIVNYMLIRYKIDPIELANNAILKNLNFFDLIHSNYNIDFDLKTYLDLYRFHMPNIKLSNDAKSLLEVFDKKMIAYSIVTDGRSISQRNKLNSLGLLDKISLIVISQETGYCKPDSYNFELIQKKHPENSFVYVGDNTDKDFIAPNKLGWDTVCLLDNGQNIHKQKFNLNKDKTPKFVVQNLSEILEL